MAVNVATRSPTLAQPALGGKEDGKLRSQEGELKHRNKGQIQPCGTNTSHLTSREMRDSSKPPKKNNRAGVCTLGPPKGLGDWVTTHDVAFAQLVTYPPWGSCKCVKRKVSSSIPATVGFSSEGISFKGSEGEQAMSKKEDKSK